jgi:hypothetical protein
VAPDPASAATTRANIPSSVQLTPEGVAPGAIKHVWLIILENKSYDATFTGLNGNTYLWNTLPQQGVLLKKYYGTGHFSEDNYLSLVSGQAPSEDVQEDCSTTDNLINSNAGIVKTGPLGAANPNYGQLDSHGGANAPLGSNGCSYPTAVPTLFQPVQRGQRQLEGLCPGPGRGPELPAGALHRVPGRDGGGPGGRRLCRARHRGQQPQHRSGRCDRPDG